MKFKQNDKLEVHWQDAFTIDKWFLLEDLIKELEKGCPQTTIGYFVAENKEWLIIAATSAGKIKYASSWFIPKKWIDKIIKLK